MPVLLGCAGLDLSGWVPDVPTEADFEASLVRWKGQPEQDFAMQFGTPVSQLAGTDGSHVSVWRWERQIPVPVGSREVYVTQNGRTTHDKQLALVGVDVMCELRVQVGQTGRIVGFAHEGATCIGALAPPGR